MTEIRRSIAVSLLPLLLSAPTQPLAAESTAVPSVVFSDDFENGLSKWRIGGEEGVELQQSGGTHGRVLRLRSNGDVHVLIRGSERWKNVAIEGDVLFPTPGDSYLGVIYHYRTHGTRTDFGLIYLKFGRRVYLQANPHRDYNVSRTFYPEFTAPLTGASEVRVGVWQRFRVEIVGGIAHFYVGDLATPALTFPIAEPGSGMLGLQPRSVGEDVWVDNVIVTSIARLSYDGPERPAAGSVTAGRDALRWEVLGPMARTDDRVARHPERGRWRSFALDPRGAVETGRVVDFHGPNTVAYFRTCVRTETTGPAILRLSSVDDLAVWVNGRFHWFAGRQDAAWFDVGTNPDHPGNPIPIDLVAGENFLVLRVRGGAYAAGGFFARVERDGELLASPAQTAR